MKLLVHENIGFVGWYNTRKGIESCFQKLYNMKTFGKQFISSSKTWIAEVNIVSL